MNKLREFKPCFRQIDGLTIVFATKDTIYLLNGINRTIVNRWWQKKSYKIWRSLCRSYKTLEHLSYSEAFFRAIDKGFDVIPARKTPDYSNMREIKGKKK